MRGTMRLFGLLYGLYYRLRYLKYLGAALYYMMQRLAYYYRRIRGGTNQSQDEEAKWR